MHESDFTSDLKKLRHLKRKASDSAEQAKLDREEHKMFQHEVWQKMAAAGLHGSKTSEARFDRKATIYHRMEDADAFYEWCEENDLLDELFADQPRKARLNEIVRSCVDNGEPLPPGLGWYAEEYIAVTENKG